MEQTVSTVQKKSFIKWLLNQNVINDREIIWLLNFLMGSEQMLRLVHFVDNVHGCKRVIEINVAPQTPDEFKYIKNSVRTDDPEKAFHDLRLNQEKTVYIKVSLPSITGCPEYFSVLEDNPSYAQIVHQAYGKAAEAAAGEAERAYKEKRLKQAINYALDKGDETSFYRLTEELKLLKAVSNSAE